MKWLLVLLVIAAVYWMVRPHLGGRPTRADMPHRAVPSVLTSAERDFAEVLERAVGGRYRLLAKVRLADLVDITASGQEWWRAFGRISQKHVDFVLVDPASWAPRLVIELDDASHRRRARRERDELVAGVCDTAGLALLRVSVRRSWDVKELAEAIDAQLQTTPVV